MRNAVLSMIAVLSVTVNLQAAPRPNIILVMADDMGWGDPAYNSITVNYPDGSPHPDQGWISTPTLDAMATSGLRFGRFYAASAVCSPTRASCLTGRNPYRVGVPFANTGRLGFDETPLSEVLSDAGYVCGHFGKWHLGSLTTLRSDSNRGGNASVYSGPWHHSYDVCFVTESKVPTYHPYRKAVNGLPLPTSFSDSNFYGTRYWRMPATWNQTSGEGDAVPVEQVNNAADGDDSKLLIDQAIPFIQDAVSSSTPFFVVIWFHTPHRPMVDPAGVAGVNSSTALKACVEDLDTALGRLRTELDTLGVRDNTMLWFTSDNGPEDGDNSPNETSTVRSIRSGRNLERKRSLHEGGVRVPGILEWPAVIGEPAGVTEFPAVTSDYYPTILDYLELSVPNQKPIDGISLRPVIEGTATTRTKPIGFQIPEGSSTDKSWVNQQYKLINDNGTWELYDLLNILAGEELEQTPLATSANIGSQPQGVQDVYNTMLTEYTAWTATVSSDTPYVHASQPTVVLSTDASEVSGPFTVTATFSESVSQLHANEFAVSNGTASGLAGSGDIWTVTISPTTVGTVSVSLPEAAVIDADGNPNAASNDLDTTYSDPSAPPVPVLSGPDKTSSAYMVNISFSKPVTGLSDEDFSVTNGTASGVSGSGSTYTVLVTPTGLGDVSVTLVADAVSAVDNGLGNTVSNTLVTTYALGLITWTGPTAVSGASDVIAEGALVEAVNCYLTSHVASNTSPTVNGVLFTGSKDLLGEDYTLDPFDFCSVDTGDSGYNDLLSTIDYGGGGDYFEISLGGGNLVSGEEYLIQVWFVDDRAGYAGRVMEYGDGNGNTVQLTAGAVTYATGTFTADGTTQTLSFDAIGFGNAHLTAYQIRESTSYPIPTLSTTAVSPVSGTFTVDIEFTELVTGLEVSDFSVTNGTASGLSGSGSTYTVLVTPTEPGDVSVTLVADAVSAVDNGAGNTVSNTLVTAYALGSIITNGDLNTTVTKIGSLLGDSTFTLNAAGNVTENGSDTGVDENQWLWTSLTRGFKYSATGGNGGGGAFVQNTDFNQKPRAVAQFANNGGAVTSWQTISMDVFLDDNTASNALKFYVELYAWDSGETAPGLSLGGPTANVLAYNVTNENDANTIFTTEILATDVADAAWETVELATVNLASGYDYYAWRIGVVGATIGDAFAFDNITVTKICNYVLVGDEDADCDVDLEDLELLMVDWLSNCNPDCDVNLASFAALAENWLVDCDVDPGNPACVPVQ